MKMFVLLVLCLLVNGANASGSSSSSSSSSQEDCQQEVEDLFTRFEDLWAAGSQAQLVNDLLAPNPIRAPPDAAIQFNAADIIASYTNAFNNGAVVVELIVDRIIMTCECDEVSVLYSFKVKNADGTVLEAADGAMLFDRFGDELKITLDIWRPAGVP